MSESDILKEEKGKKYLKNFIINQEIFSEICKNSFANKTEIPVTFFYLFYKNYMIKINKEFFISENLKLKEIFKLNLKKKLEETNKILIKEIEELKNQNQDGDNFFLTQKQENKEAQLQKNIKILNNNLKDSNIEFDNGFRNKYKEQDQNFIFYSNIDRFEYKNRYYKNKFVTQEDLREILVKNNKKILIYDSQYIKTKRNNLENAGGNIFQDQIRKKENINTAGMNLENCSREIKSDMNKFYDYNNQNYCDRANNPKIEKELHSYEGMLKLDRIFTFDSKEEKEYDPTGKNFKEMECFDFELTLNNCDLNNLTKKDNLE